MTDERTAGDPPADDAGADAVPTRPFDGQGRHQRPAPPPDRPPLPMGVRPAVPNGRPPVPGAHHADRPVPQQNSVLPAASAAGWGPPPAEVDSVFTRATEPLVTPAPPVSGEPNRRMQAPPLRGHVPPQAPAAQAGPLPYAHPPTPDAARGATSRPSSARPDSSRSSSSRSTSSQSTSSRNAQSRAHRHRRPDPMVIGAAIVMVLLAVAVLVGILTL
ncbi:hypothetical protein [Gordonia polyisoprenivorans]|uniref:hypothetical protein n=1 Tax=Gordonia polyisoprenivorans TaxID=84595 RepID=UPI001AD7207E|nr:hypothetical protein [Gordonia polyisoprenivorans]QTI68870.1 hypothetical protein J6U32_26010 [Gordonia polyisoprenivorans]